MTRATATAKPQVYHVPASFRKGQTACYFSARLISLKTQTITQQTMTKTQRSSSFPGVPPAILFLRHAHTAIDN